MYQYKIFDQYDTDQILVHMAHVSMSTLIHLKIILILFFKLQTIYISVNISHIHVNIPHQSAHQNMSHQKHDPTLLRYINQQSYGKKITQPDLGTGEIRHNENSFPQNKQSLILPGYPCWYQYISGHINTGLVHTNLSWWTHRYDLYYTTGCCCHFNNNWPQVYHHQ